MTLKYVLETWDKIGSTPSIIAKERIIKESMGIEHFAKASFLALNNMIKFKIREIEYISPSPATVDNIWEYLEKLSKQSGASLNDRLLLSNLASIDEETVEAVNRILKGDLRCGAGIALFKKYIKSIPDHKQMLCIDDVDKFITTAGSFDNIASSIKLDGVRVWAVVEETGIKYLSRNGKEFPNFEIFDDELREAASNPILGLEYPIIFDGEVISRDKDFQRCLSNFRKLKEADTSIFDFKVFDVVCSLPFIERYKLITSCFPKNSDTKRVHHVPHMLGILGSKEEIYELLEDVTKEGEEGLVLKTMNGPYEFRRSNHWCKVKSFDTVDLEVLAYKYGTGKYKEVLGAFICDFNGVEVDVGSGFTDLERKEFLEDPPKMIEVSYQSITRDKSLRFPVFIRSRDDK